MQHPSGAADHALVVTAEADLAEGAPAMPGSVPGASIRPRRTWAAERRAFGSSLGLAVRFLIWATRNSGHSGGDGP